MIYGIGTDIVELDRMRGALERQGERFMTKSFTERECDLARDKRDPVPFLAGRWAAKEAIAKALGTGFGQHCAWQDIEILNDDLGKPTLTLSGAAASFATKQSLGTIHLSISHEHSYAVAMAVAEKEDV